MRQEIDSQRLKPGLQEIMSAFYSGRREASSGERIPFATLQRLAQTINYESDYAISLMQQMDDKLIELQNEKQQREMERMKTKGSKR